MTNKHKNSRTVTLYRASTFVSDSQKGIDDFFASSSRSIGSYWESPQSKVIGSGLTIGERKLLLPPVIDIDPTEREFIKAVRTFYEEITTKIPHKTGLTLEIGLEKDNEADLSEDNMPLNVMDYIRYKHAQGHPQMAKDLDEAKANQLKLYYISDPNALKVKNSSLRELKDKAMEYYLIVKKSEATVDNYLALLGEDPRGFTDMQDKLEVLNKFVNAPTEEDLNRFIKLYEDPKTEAKAILRKMVHTGVLRMVGTRFLIAETDQILGNTLEEALHELADEAKNSELITILKANLQEKMKIQVKRKQTAQLK